MALSHPLLIKSGPRESPCRITESTERRAWFEVKSNVTKGWKIDDSIIDVATSIPSSESQGHRYRLQKQAFPQPLRSSLR